MACGHFTPEGIFPKKKAQMSGALKERLVARALEEGFSGAGVCAPGAVPEAAGRLQAAVLEVTRDRRGRTGDLGGTASTEAVADAIIARLAGRRASPRPSASRKRPTRAPRAPRRRP